MGVIAIFCSCVLVVGLPVVVWLIARWVGSDRISPMRHTRDEVQEMLRQGVYDRRCDNCRWLARTYACGGDIGWATCWLTCNCCDSEWRSVPPPPPMNELQRP